MKKSIFLLFILILLTGCSFSYNSTDGKVNKAETTIYKNNNHKEEDINKAIDSFKLFFKDSYYKCNLLNIEYGNNEDLILNEELIKTQNNSEEALALTFTFKTSKEAYKTLESDKEYTFYAYMAIIDGNWTVVNTGEVLV